MYLLWECQLAMLKPPNQTQILSSCALSKLNMQHDVVVMLGDTPYDIESANKAGVGVIAFRCGGFDDSQLKDAIAIYDDPSDLLTHYDSSPLATKAMTRT